MLITLIYLLKLILKNYLAIKMSPYKAIFGHEMYIGLEEFNLDAEKLTSINTAKKLYELLGNYTKLLALSSMWMIIIQITGVQ